MRHLDLFAGIGGFSRAVEWLGGTTVAFVEWEAWNRRVLAKHWPEAQFFGDIKAVTAEQLHGLGPIDLITGGYPCQPFSVAGQRRGKDDPRHLWPEMRRVIDTVRPRVVLAENVSGHVSMGLDTVLAEMESDGYTAGAIVVPAAGVNALHKRDRVWIIATAQPLADAEHIGHERRQQAGAVQREGASHQQRGAEFREEPARGGIGATLAEAYGERQSQPEGIEQDERGRAGDGGSEDPVAHPNHDGAPERGQCQDTPGEGAEWGDQPRGGDGHARQVPAGGAGEARSVGYAHGAGLEGRVVRGERAGERAAGQAGGEPLGDTGQASRAVDALFDGLPARLVRRPAARSAWDDPDLIRAMWADGSWEADLPRVVTDEPERRQKLMAAGNAIVPLVAYEILRVMFQEDAA